MNRCVHYVTLTLLYSVFLSNVQDKFEIVHHARVQLVADPRNFVLKKCACPSFYVVNYADLLSKAQNMHTLHFFKMHTSFLLSIENNLRLIVFVLIARKKCCRAVEETS